MTRRFSSQLKRYEHKLTPGFPLRCPSRAQSHRVISRLRGRTKRTGLHQRMNALRLDPTQLKRLMGRKKMPGTWTLRRKRTMSWRLRVSMQTTRRSFCLPSKRMDDAQKRFRGFSLRYSSLACNVDALHTKHVCKWFLAPFNFSLFPHVSSRTKIKPGN